MVDISSSQKKTAFAVVLLALIAVGVMISGRGGFSGLRSDVFNNSSFVCTDASLISGEVRYNGTTATLQNLSTEKTALQTKIQGWNADIRKNEASIKKLEREKAAAEKRERALEVAVKKQCTPRALATCAAKKQELQDIKQDIKKIRSSLTNEQNQNKSIRTNIQSAESSVKLLEKQILEIQNFKADYETCKKALEKEKTEVASFDLIVSGEVFVNEPFDMTVRALDASGKVITNYEGKIFFDSDIFSDEQNPNLCSILGICPVVKIASPHNGEYTFTPTDKGIKLFEKGWTISPAGVYDLTVFELNGPNGGIGKTVKVVAKNRTSAATCTDSDGGINLDIKGFGYDGIKYSADNPVYDHCHPQNANIVRELYCREDGVINNKEYTCPYGCSEGACKTGPYCGNGIKEGFEQCDDGNTNNNDSCDNNCKNTGSTISGEVGVGGKLTVSLDSYTPLLSRLLLDNTTEHELAVFRLAASNKENLDLKSIKIANFGTGGINGVNFYKFYNGANLLGTATPDSSGNAELFLTDGTLIITANDYKLVTVKAVLRDIDGINFKNGDTLITAIKPAGYIKTVGMTSGNLITSTEANMIGDTMIALEAYPLVTFAHNDSMSSAIALSSSQLLAKIAISNPGNKDVTFQSSDGNNFSIQLQVIGDDTDGNREAIVLKDQDGITLDAATISSATGITQVDFDMSSVGINGLIIPASGIKYLYLFADTSDLEDNDDIIQAWFDNEAADVTFGINGSGAFSLGNIIFPGKFYGPVLSRSF